MEKTNKKECPKCNNKEFSIGRQKEIHTRTPLEEKTDVYHLCECKCSEQFEYRPASKNK